MKDFLKKLVSLIVDNPEAVEIREKEEEGLNIYTILVPEEEVGKIIGKGGRVINALRSLSRLKAAQTHQRVIIKVEASQSGKGLSLPTADGEAGSPKETPA